MVEPELKKLLEENLAIAKNNNEVLRTMRHHQWISSVVSLLFWIGLAALPIYLYQQYLRPVFERFNPEGTGSNGLFVIPTSADLEKLINSFRAQE